MSLGCLGSGRDADDTSLIEDVVETSPANESVKLHAWTCSAAQSDSLATHVARRAGKMAASFQWADAGKVQACLSIHIADRF